MPALDAAIAAYRVALDDLQSPVATDVTMRVLLSRDDVTRALAADPGPTGGALTTLAELDGRLRAAAPQIERAIGSKTLASWRQTAALNSIGSIVAGSTTRTPVGDFSNSMR